MAKAKLAAKRKTTNESKQNWWFLGGRSWIIFAVLAALLLGLLIGRFVHFAHIAESARIQAEIVAEQISEEPLPAATQETLRKLPEKACAAAEELLLSQMQDDRLYDEFSGDPRIHFARARQYSKLSAKACPESREKYRQLALRELEIGFALGEDRMDEWVQMEVIDTYTKLEMKAEAEKFFDKMKQLTDPTIDFIIQVKRIIEE